MDQTEVLFVEDSAGDALLTQQILAESTLPVRLHIARDGEQPLAMLRDERFRPAMIILDLSLRKYPVSRCSNKTPASTFPW
jgi:CheY-like chemotaxis protein